MNYPRQECGECPYWLAYGEPETTDEQNEAILAHCAQCSACDGKCFECDLFNPDTEECGKKDYNEAQEHVDKMMRAARQKIVLRKTIHEEDAISVINYDDTDGDVSDAEYKSAAEEAYDNMVRSLIEASGEIRELKEMLREAKDALLYMLILHKAQDPRCNQEKVIPALFMLQSGPDKWTIERTDEVFKKIFDYLEQEEK